MSSVGSCSVGSTPSRSACSINEGDCTTETGQENSNTDPWEDSDDNGRESGSQNGSTSSGSVDSFADYDSVWCSGPILKGIGAESFINDQGHPEEKNAPGNASRKSDMADAEPLNGYFNEVWESWGEDWQEVKTDWSKTSNYSVEQSVGSTVLQQVGNVVDFGVDAIGSVIVNDKTKIWTKHALEQVSNTEAYQTVSQELAEITGETIETVNHYLDKNPKVKEVLLETAQAGMEKTQQVIDYTKQVAAEHPEAARNLGAIGDILQAIPVGKGLNLTAKGGAKVLDVTADVAGRIEIDVEPGTLGANGGNISIRLSKPQTVLLNDPFPTQTRPSELLAGAGFRVEQQPTRTHILTPEMQSQLQLNPKKNPDYLIEGRVFDNYAPSEIKTSKGIHRVISEKVGEGQAHRIVVNLADATITRKQVVDSLKADPIENLKEVIVIEKDGIIKHFLPTPNHTPSGD